MIRLPSPDLFDDLKIWAARLISVLGDKFAREVEEDAVGRIDIFVGNLPESYLPVDGTEFDSVAAPQLALKLGDTFGTPSAEGKCVLPDLDSPFEDTVIGIKK